MQLEGRTALITGAAKRIGREIALELARQGMDIVIHYGRSRRQALSLQQQIERLGVRGILLRAQISPHGEISGKVKRLAQAAYRKAGAIDVLINNAAVFYPTPFGRITEKQWEEFMTVNLKAPFFLAQEIGKRMVRQKRGKIVNLVDAAVLRPSPRYLPYAISKAGLMAATQGLAKALAPHVQVASIAPGPILPAKGSHSKQNRIAAGRTLLKRFGHPHDIAAAVRYFLQDTDFVTGVMIPVDGGASIV